MKPLSEQNDIALHFPLEATLFLTSAVSKNVFEEVKKMLKRLKYGKKLELWNRLFWQAPMAKDHQPNSRAPMLTLTYDDESPRNTLSIKPTTQTELNAYLRFRGKYYPTGQRKGRTPERIFNDIALSEGLVLLMEFKKCSLDQAIEILIIAMCKEDPKYNKRASLKSQIRRSANWIIEKGQQLLLEDQEQKKRL